MFQIQIRSIQIRTVGSAGSVNIGTTINLVSVPTQRTSEPPRVPVPEIPRIPAPQIPPAPEV